MRAVSNTGASPKSCAKATASRLMLGTSRKISPPPTLASKADRTTSAVARSSATSGPIWRPLPAWTDHAPAGKPAIAHERATDMPERADPGAQERGARSRKHRRVVHLYSRQWDVGQRDDPSLRRIRGRDGAAVTDVGISELEPDLSVVLLLRHHAVEPDHAWASVRDGRIPYAQSVPAP